MVLGRCPVAKARGRSLAMLGGAGELYSGHWSSRDGLRLELSLVPASVSCDDIDLPAPCHSRAHTKQSQVWAIAELGFQFHVTKRHNSNFHL